MSVDLSDYPPEIVKKAQDRAREIAKELGYYITWNDDGEFITDVRGYTLNDAELANAQESIVKELVQRGID